MRISLSSPRLPLVNLVLLCVLSCRSTVAKMEPETVAPSQSPSFAPTSEPTLNSTLSPTQSATTLPSLNLTIPETSAPTSRPTTTPTNAVITSQVRLPAIGMDIVVEDEKGIMQSTQELEDYLSAFMYELLENNSGVDSFDYAALEFDFIHSSFRRRKLASGLSVRIEGIVFYGSNPPSSDNLAMSLWTYFAVWGIDELENYLHGVGLPSARVAAVTIANEVVRPAEGSEGHNTGATVQRPQTKRDETASVAAIAGLVAACTLIVLVLAFMVLGPRNRKLKIEQPSQPSPVGDSNLTVPSGAVSPMPTEVVQDIDEQSLGVLSADMSIYTTDDTVFSGRIQNKYDTKRLDRIIEMGKKHTDSERISI